jgi:hypothetical protein
MTATAITALTEIKAWPAVACDQAMQAGLYPTIRGPHDERRE